MTDPLAYTYDADYHCPTCTLARFGTDNAEAPTDSEGNAVGALFSWDEWHEPTMLGQDQTLVCGTCGGEMDYLRADPSAMTWRNRARYMLADRYGMIENSPMLGRATYHGRLWHRLTGLTSAENGAQSFRLEDI